jgi:hypothetical protein
MSNERNTGERMKHFGNLGFHPGALPRGKHHDGER